MAGYGQQYGGWGAQAGGGGGGWGGQQQGWAQQRQQQAGGGGGWAQQAQAQPQAAQQQANSKDVTLVVTGCTHATVGGIVRGTFQLEGENHGKPTYKKDGQVNGLDVMTYYWDERDGPGFCGWWFGPKVGGDQVWAYHSDKNASMPPQSGWKVPYDGPVDPTFVISQKPKAGAAAPAAAGYGQQQAQQQQAQQGWNQQGWNQQQGYQQQGYQPPGMQQKMEEQKKKMEEMKRQQQALMQRRAEEQKKKEEELEKKKVEQVAVLSIRRVMQKFRATTPDKYEDSRKELDEVIAKELEACGSQKERLTTEIEQAVTATKQRIDQIAEMKRKEEEKKQAEMNRRKELHQKANELVKEFEGLLEKADEKRKGIEEEAEPLTGDMDKEMRIAEIEACSSAVEEAAKEVAAAVLAASEFATKETANIRNIPPIEGEPSTAPAEFGKLVVRLGEVKKATSTCMAKFNTSKSLRTKRAHAKAKYDKSLEPFVKYDNDKDGKLSRKEIQAFSKGEFSFVVPVPTLDTICKLFVKEDEKGIAKERFQAMKVMIGVAREAAIDAKRREAREAREKMIDETKEKMLAQIKKAAELIAAAGESVGQAEKQTAPFTVAKAKEMTSTEMTAAADAADAALEACKKSFSSAKDAVSALSKDETEAELKIFLTSEVKKLEVAARPFEQRIKRATEACSKWRVDAQKKAHDELEKLRTDGLSLIFHHMGVKKLDNDGVFQEMDKNKDGKIEESEFVKFFKTCSKKDADDGVPVAIDAENAARLFSYLDSDEEGFIVKEKFLSIIRKFMKVKKASVITDDINIKSKIIRRLDEGEVLEVVMGPLKEADAEVSRVRVKAMKDDVDGWVTPVGNQGTVFLADGGDLFKVVKETILTGSFIIGGDSKVKDRKLKVGEICQVREWARKEENSGLMRMKVRVQSDGQIGWATSVGNTGITFLECI